MSNSFNYEKFIALGFRVTAHQDSWGREIIEHTYKQDGTEFKLRKKDDSEFVMGVCSSKSGEWERHIVDEEEALRWFHRTFPDVVL